MLSSNSYRKLQSDSSVTRPKRTRSKSTSRLPTVPEKPKKKITMKVKELRSWLSDLGEKNQEHFHRFHRPKSPPGDDLLGIQSKPSMGSSCPSTEIMQGTNDPLFEASFLSDDDNSSSSSSENVARNSFYQKEEHPRKKHAFENHVSTKDHLALLLKQAPRTQEECSYSVNYEDDRDDCESLATYPGRRRSSLFRDQILTKDALDAMSGSTVVPPKTLGEQLRALKKDFSLEQVSAHDSSYHGDTEDGSKSDGSTDSLSIGPSVLVSKMANVFLNQQHLPPPPAPVQRRKQVELPDFLRIPEATRAPREDLAYANPPKTPTTTVGKGIRKFGGPPKTLVERRKEQLQQRFGDNRSAVFVQKKTWGQKNPHGKYERTTRVEKVYK